MTRAATKPRSRADIGRANRDKGHRAERDLGRYLRVHGWPKAERKSDTGWTASDRESPDLGDIRGTHPLVWQVRIRDRAPSSRDILDMLHATGNQAVAAGADHGILVLRREGHGNPGQWWAYVTVGDLASLIAEADGKPLPVPQQAHQRPVRLELDDLLPLLHAAGYGEPDEL